MSEDSPSHQSYFERFADLPLNNMLGITLVHAEGGKARICLNQTDATPSGIGGSVHGGVLAAMVDEVMLCAVFSDMREGALPAGTADLGITYLRQAHGPKVYADAEVVKRGRMLANVEVSITDNEGRLCARGRVIYAFRQA